MEWRGGIRRWSGEEGLEDGVGRRDEGMCTENLKVWGPAHLSKCRSRFCTFSFNNLIFWSVSSSVVKVWSN